jgi:small GTP-binding protein
MIQTRHTNGTQWPEADCPPEKQADKQQCRFSTRFLVIFPNNQEYKHMQDTTQKLIKSISQAAPTLTEVQLERIGKLLETRINYKPEVGLFGKTGVGKSSLCNALFGSEICKVSAVESCTREAQSVDLGIGKTGKIALWDVPGVGENETRDGEYAQLYADLLPQLDVVLWVLKADERAYSVDIEFYNRMVKPRLTAGAPFFFVLNQVDKIEPSREWNEGEHRPGLRQAQNIDAKKRVVAASFDVPLSQVLCVSAGENFGLEDLVEEVVYKLPSDKKFAWAANVKSEHVNEKTREQAKQGLWDGIVEVVGEAWSGFKDTCSDAWDWFTSWF